MSPWYAIAYLHENGFLPSPSVSQTVWICCSMFKGISVLTWLISLYSGLNFLHGQRSYLLLECKSPFCFVVQSRIAISLKKIISPVSHFKLNSCLSHILIIKMANKQNLNVFHFLPNPSLFLCKLLYPGAIVKGYSYSISIKSWLVLQPFNQFCARSDFM